MALKYIILGAVLLRQTKLKLFNRLTAYFARIALGNLHFAIIMGHLAME